MENKKHAEYLAFDVRVLWHFLNSSRGQLDMKIPCKNSPEGGNITTRGAQRDFLSCVKLVSCKLQFWRPFLAHGACHYCNPSLPPYVRRKNTMGMWVRQLFEALLLKTPLSSEVNNPQVEKNWSSNFFPVQICKSTFGQTITDSFDEIYGLPV